MKFTLQSCFDLAFLLPLDVKVDDPAWIESNISQFLVYCNSCLDTIQTAKFLWSHLPWDSWDGVVWYHSGMSDASKKEVKEKFKSGQIWGICCTDTCGMVRQNPTRYSRKATERYLGSQLMQSKHSGSVASP